MYLLIQYVLREGCLGENVFCQFAARDAAMTIFKDILKTTERYNLKEGN
jgi:hypothetical protein